MLVSGMMSDNETTSSFPDRLPELSKAPPASMLKQKKDNLYDIMTNTREKKYIYYTVQSYDPSLPCVPVRRTLVKICICSFVHFNPYRPAEKRQSTDY